MLPLSSAVFPPLECLWAGLCAHPGSQLQWKEPCCSILGRAGSLFPHQAALGLFQAPSWNRSFGACVGGDISQLSRTIFLFLLCQPLSHPCPQAAPSDLSLSANSSFSHYSPHILFWMVHPHDCCPGFFLSFQNHDIWRPCKDFSLSCCCPLQSMLTLLEFGCCPLFGVTPCLCLPDFIPAPHFSFEEHLCCSHICAALLLSLPAVVLCLWWFSWCGSRECSHTSAAPPAPLGTLLGQNPLPIPLLAAALGCFTAHSPAQSYFSVPGSPSSATGLSLCPHSHYGATPTPVFHPSHSLISWSKCHMALCALHVLLLHLQVSRRAEKCSLKLDQIPLHELIPGSNPLPWG